MGDLNIDVLKHSTYCEFCDSLMGSLYFKRLNNLLTIICENRKFLLNHIYVSRSNNYTIKLANIMDDVSDDIC